MMNRTTMDIWVGIFVAIGIAATVFVSLRVANLASSTSGATYQVTAEFRNIGGLKVRAPVKSAGVVVGRVTNIQLDTTSYQARVTMALDQQYSFSKDTTAGILTSGLLGEQYVGLEIGGDEQMLQDNDRIEFTSSALVLENLIGEFMFNKASETQP